MFARINDNYVFHISKEKQKENQHIADRVLCKNYGRDYFSYKPTFYIIYKFH